MKDIYEWEVLTPTGWQDFTGIVEYEKSVLTIKLNNGTELTASETHRVLTINGVVEMKDLVIGSIIMINSGTALVTEISAPGIPLTWRVRP